MKKKKNALINVLAISLIFLSFIACDKDFSTLESDIINNNNATNFDIESAPYDVIAYTEVLGPVQTNNLGLNTLGVYDDLYGKTTSSFVTQLTPRAFSPDFGQNAIIDSVILTIPYFSRVSEIEDDGTILYKLDSVINNNDFKLELFENNFFLRDFNPNADFNEAQAYFSNKSASTTEFISNGVLEGTPINYEYENENGVIINNNTLEISDKGHILTEVNDNMETEVSARLTPGVRLKLAKAFWQQKIIDQGGNSVLSSQNNFSEYFRGIYFKATPINDEGSFLILNLGATNANITIYYKKDAPTDSDPNAKSKETYTLGFGSNRVNFMDNDFNIALNNGDSNNGDEKIYLKGGEGSIAKLKLFNGEDLDEDNNSSNNFESWKNQFVETDNNGKFVKSKRLVNEANLVFHVDENVNLNGGNENQPNRIYLYDIDNKRPLVDYFLDGTNNIVPSVSKINHLGNLQRVDDDPNSNGVKYKIRITEHINNLLLRDSTNVELGIAVSLNVNLEESVLQRQVQTLDDLDITTPVSSIITPRGTILYGNNTTDETKKVYLEIYYTEPNN